jgi:hypothetical protein
MTDPDIKLPWSVKGLMGRRSDSGATYNGGYWSGSASDQPTKTLTVRLTLPYSAPAHVEVDLGDHGHGCTASLTPDMARQYARALTAAADQADTHIETERAKYQALRNELKAMSLAAAANRAGVTEEARAAAVLLDPQP